MANRSLGHGKVQPVGLLWKAWPTKKQDELTREPQTGVKAKLDVGSNI